jgi:hypothetical protein
VDLHLRRPMTRRGKLRGARVEAKGHHSFAPSQGMHKGARLMPKYEHGCSSFRNALHLEGVCWKYGIFAV